MSARRSVAALVLVLSLGVVACLDFDKASRLCETAGRCVDGGLGGQDGGEGDAGTDAGAFDGGPSDGGPTDGGGSTTDGGCDPASCEGCCEQGQCVPTFVQTPTHCGLHAACAACPIDWACGGGACVRDLGADCDTDTQCAQGLGTNATCRHVTSRGNGTYDGGYCTRPCLTSSECGDGGQCQDVSAFGEDDALCFRRCSFDGGIGCRDGYSCQAITPNAVDAFLSTTIAGLPPPICFISPPPPQGDAGFNDLGKPCGSRADCPAPYSSQCIPPTPDDAGVVRWTGGYCAADCRSGDQVCGPRGVCALFEPGTNLPSFSICLEACTSTLNACRVGYHCSPLTTYPDGGINSGFCLPNCHDAAADCGAGYLCKGDGYCCDTNTGACF